jgi:beta-xylosidase
MAYSSRKSETDMPRRRKVDEFRYRNALATPIVWKGPSQRSRPNTIAQTGYEAPEEARSRDAEHEARLIEAYAEVATEAGRKLDLLFGTFPNIEKGDYFKLALGLAHRHVPGFQVQYAKPARGAKPKWLLKDLQRLHRRAEDLRRVKQRPNSEIARSLKREPAYSRFEVGTLQNQLTLADQLVDTFGSHFTNMPEDLASLPLLKDFLIRIRRSLLP